MSWDEKWSPKTTWGAHRAQYIAGSTGPGTGTAGGREGVALRAATGAACLWDAGILGARRQKEQLLTTWNRGEALQHLGKISQQPVMAPLSRITVLHLCLVGS